MILATAVAAQFIVVATVFPETWGIDPNETGQRIEVR